MASRLRSGNTIAHTASGADVVGGTAVLKGVTLGVAPRTIPDGETGELEITGCYTFDKLTGAGTGGAAGAVAYWNAAGSKITAASAGNTAVGKFGATCDDADETCQVILTP